MKNLMIVTNYLSEHKGEFMHNDILGIIEKYPNEKALEKACKYIKFSENRIWWKSEFSNKYLTKFDENGFYLDNKEFWGEEGNKMYTSYMFEKGYILKANKRIVKANKRNIDARVIETKLFVTFDRKRRKEIHLANGDIIIEG